MLKWIVAASFFLALSVNATFSSSEPDHVVSRSRLMINIPHSLYREDGYDHHVALFGMPAYGGSLALPVFFTDESLCSKDTVDKSKFRPERKDSDIDPYILMMNRGGCSFVEIVRKAQQSGASAVVVADNLCWCADENCKRRSGTSVCESQRPIMADDGSGKDISIPSFLMFKSDADSLKDEICAGRPVQIEMAWGLPTPDVDHVKYDLWTSPSDTLAKDFVSDFRPLVDHLGSSAFFTPHMYIFDGTKSGCLVKSGEPVCGNLCTNSGRYCATALNLNVTGADVVRESLRRICVWREYGRDGQGAEWWEYVKVFNDQCNNPNQPARFKDVDCIQDVMKKAKIDMDKIDKCMLYSGGVDDTGYANEYLELEVVSRQQNGVVVIPTLSINSAAMRGALTSGNVFTAICSGFSKGLAPEACKCFGCADPAQCISNQYKCDHIHTTSSFGDVSTSFFVISMLCVIAGFTAAGIWNIKRTKDEIGEQVAEYSEYTPLEDNDNDSRE